MTATPPRLPSLPLAPQATALDLDVVLASYARDGYARLGPVLGDAALAALRDRVDDVLLGRLVLPGLFFQRDSPTGAYEDLRFGGGWEGPAVDYRKIEKIEVDPVFRAFLENPLFERIARRWIEGPIALYRAVVWNKCAAGGTALPWHQDGGTFWGIDRPPTLQIWIALDDAPEDGGCVELIPGSHTTGLCTPQGGTIPDEIIARHIEQAVALPVRAGEGLLIHNHVFHRSGRNHAGHPRRALSFCYMSAATRCLRKKREPRHFVRLFEDTGGSGSR